MLRSAIVALTLVLAPARLAGADEARLLDSLVAAYPDFLAGHEKGVLLWKDGTRMPFSDGKEGLKDFATRLDAPSLKDQFHAPYRTGPLTHPPAPDMDPGRVRYEPLFVKMYGDCRRKGDVEKNLVEIVWLPRKWGRTIRVTRVNGVDQKLAAVSAELDQLPAELDPLLFPPAGTLNCRMIAGTRRLSTHGFAMAIDIATRHAHYWRWSKRDATGRYPYRNAIPHEIVEIFERHGFIWGGKWYHYDTMHFEYRPELIAAGRLTAAE